MMEDELAMDSLSTRKAIDDLSATDAEVEVEHEVSHS